MTKKTPLQRYASGAARSGRLVVIKEPRVQALCGQAKVVELTYLDEAINIAIIKTANGHFVYVDSTDLTN